MAPILNTFSKNQFDILASTTGGNDAANKNGNDDNKASAFEELTKDLIGDDDDDDGNVLDGFNDNDDVLSLTQELDWDDFGGSNGNDVDAAAASDADKSVNNDASFGEETFGSQGDDSGEEAELSLETTTPPSSGRQKAKPLRWSRKDKASTAADDDDDDDDASEKLSEMKDSSDDDELDGDSGDDKTVDMSDEEEDKAGPEEIKATNATKEPPAE
ncbi:MAG: hypothetical protein SGARI_006661, partial [Bacillariaceae sp.]